MVAKLVRVPPSQRVTTWGMPARSASLRMTSWALALGADEEDALTVGDGVADEVGGVVQAGDGLGEVEDVDAVARAVDERGHFRVPSGPVW